MSWDDKLLVVDGDATVLERTRSDAVSRSWHSSLSSADPSSSFPPPRLPLMTANLAVEMHNTFRKEMSFHRVDRHHRGDFHHRVSIDLKHDFIRHDLFTPLLHFEQQHVGFQRQFKIHQSVYQLPTQNNQYSISEHLGYHQAHSVHPLHTISITNRRHKSNQSQTLCS
jgi:hypothetical protein